MARLGITIVGCFLALLFSSMAHADEFMSFAEKQMEIEAQDPFTVHQSSLDFFSETRNRYLTETSFEIFGFQPYLSFRTEASELRIGWTGHSDHILNFTARW